MSRPLYTHAQHLTARAAGPKLKPYFVSTTCSRLDSIYQRGSCWIYWKEWISSGSGRPNPDRELFFFWQVVQWLWAQGCRPALGTLCYQMSLGPASPQPGPHGTSSAPQLFVLQAPVCVPFSWKEGHFFLPRSLQHHLGLGWKCRVPGSTPDLCICTYRCLVNAWGAGVVTVVGAMGRDPSWPPWAGGSWAVCSAQHGSTEERLGSYIMWLSKVPPGGQEAEKPLFNYLNLEPNSPFPQRHKVLFTQFQ